MKQRNEKDRFNALLRSTVGNFPSELYDLICEVSTTPYEGRECTGSLHFRSGAKPTGRDNIKLSPPIQEFSSRGLRKALELTTKTLSLVFDGNRICGLNSGTSGTTIRFHGNGLWNLEIDGKIQLHVDANDHLSKEKVLGELDFYKHLQIVFGKMDSRQMETLWSIGSYAVSQPHGMNILITPHAQTEAKRLSSQCIPIAPVPLDNTLIRKFAQIDGTTIADTHGKVHAASAILDGDHSSNGSWERGGRYNSAVNYVCSRPFPTMVLTVSQDGGIEVLPPIGQSSEPWIQERYQRLSSTAI